MLETLTRAIFTEYQNENFQLQSDFVDSCEVELIEVSGLTKHTDLRTSRMLLLSYPD